MAPEILSEKCRRHCRQADVWALGICMLIMLTKKQPYSGESFQQLRKQIIAG
jgi:serine/threonine protein kinase